MNDLIDQAFLVASWSEFLYKAGALLALCSLRLFVVFSILPPTAHESFQGAARNGMCLVLAAFVAWGQPGAMVASITMPQLAVLLLKEALVGVLIGFAVSVVFWVAEGVGTLIDNSAGYNNVQQVNPLSGEQSTPIGNLLSQLAIMGFYTLGGMVVCVGIIFESFRWWPVGTWEPTLGNGLMSFLDLQMHSYFASTVKIATPLMVVLVLVDLGFGLLSRTAEGLEPNNLGQPVKGVVAILMLALLVSVFFDQARNSLALGDIAAQLRHWLGR